MNIILLIKQDFTLQILYHILNYLFFLVVKEIVYGIYIILHLCNAKTDIKLIINYQLQRLVSNCGKK